VKVVKMPVIKVKVDTSEMDMAIVKAERLQQVVTNVDIKSSHAIAIKVLREIAEDILKKTPDRIDACRLLLEKRI
jgi:hypothetical protein